MDARAINAAAQAEQQRIGIISQMLEITNDCLNICVRNLNVSQLSTNEANCLHNCTQRSIDVTILASKKAIEAIGGGKQA